jgi:small subunit ribosomal protein S17
MKSGTEPGTTQKGAGTTPGSGTGAGGAAGATGRRRRKTLVGLVISDKMQKTRTVLVSRHERHPKYGKYVRRMTKYKVHDEGEASREGDVVRISETRPLSRTKRWRLVGVVERSRLARVRLEELRDDVGAALPSGKARPSAPEGGSGT